MKVYLDVSCLNRPFDDQSQARIALESQAVVLILEKVSHDKVIDKRAVELRKLGFKEFDAYHDEMLLKLE